MRKIKEIERRTDSKRRSGALDHDEFGLSQSKLINVIDSNILERDSCEKPVPTFSHRALGKKPDQGALPITVQISSTIFLTRPASSPSTITRINGSVPEGRMTRRPALPSFEVASA